ncbi:hypothetical protein GJ496_007165 [Pomphorhynchus laevis]|nr:hypothetical protein GJ496_007165 [Pomphorhynchus laevis]
MVDRLKDDDSVRGAWELSGDRRVSRNRQDLSVADDPHRINLAELDGIVKEQLKPIHIKDDSATLVKRRLKIVQSLQEDCNLRLLIDLVMSTENKANVLTRVPAN